MGQESGGYPLDALAEKYLASTIEGWDNPRSDLAEPREIRDWLAERGLVATQKREPFPGQIARIRIDAYGESASEVEATLLEFAGRCDAATQTPECAYGAFVIERNLEEEYGKLYSWKGRITLHPSLGRESFVPAGRLQAALDG